MGLNEFRLDDYVINRYGDTSKDGEGYVLALDTPVSFTIRMQVPLQTSKKITSFTGKVAEGVRTSEFTQPALGSTECTVLK